MLKVRCQGVKDTMQRSIFDKPKNAWEFIGLGTTKWDLDLLMFWYCPRACKHWSRACRSCSTWDPSRCHLKNCKPGTMFKLLSWKLECKVDLNGQACVRAPVFKLNLWDLNHSSVNGASNFSKEKIQCTHLSLLPSLICSNGCTFIALSQHP